MRQSGPVMVLSGEADMHAAAQLRELLVAQLFRGRRRLVIDVAGLRHIDSSHGHRRGEGPECGDYPETLAARAQPQRADGAT
jgi:hypothetical protein